jgi:predicted metal-dependent enzyme (double-stranded beta helix superfamily)
MLVNNDELSNKDVAPDNSKSSDKASLPSERAANKYHYGLQPGATSLIAELAKTLTAATAYRFPRALAGAAKASLRSYLREAALLAPEHRLGHAEHYQRHLLYADPNHRFSVLAIVWQPGQFSAIHGHTAWGAMGVYEGHPFSETFDTGITETPVMNLAPQNKLRLKPGDLATVQPGINDTHRIGNDGSAPCITIHVYGRDLLASPSAINIIFNS